ncbi:MAG TPA: TonB-dependent receptor [Minicystis sp.]|nr:TonB-dependent receptor [Minicystis sp.]
MDEAGGSLRRALRALLAFAIAVGSALIAGDARADPASSAPGPAPGAPAPVTPAAAAPSDAAPIEVTIEAEKPGSEMASRTSIGHVELELRPRLRPGDIVEAVPGLFAVQHAGGGKANQYFLRGFDADHGTDVAFFVDGIPVNMPSHGHGQGYSDLHFVIPELVTSLQGYKGVYYASLGDFATAGAVDMRLAEKFDESYARFEVGQYGVLRGLVVESPDLGDTWRAVAAAEFYRDDGPFINPEQLDRFNLYAKVTHDLGPSSKVALTWMSYGSSWYGSGQIPARAVCGEGEEQYGNLPPEAYGAHCIDHFGSVDPSEGGDTQRHMAALSFDTALKDADLSVQLYYVRYRFKLFSDFTFFLEDPVHGDEIEQNDDRNLFGTNLRFRRQDRYGGVRFTSTLGAEVRVDTIGNSLWHDERRERLNPVAIDGITESEIGMYAEEDARLDKYVRFILGGRAQRIDVDVDDHLDDTTTLGDASSGTKGATMFLPKFIGVFSPHETVDLYGAWGRGFHSNDARGVVQQRNPATLMVPAVGYEAGARVKPLKDLHLEAAAFLLDLQSELVWSGDTGGTEASGQSRRYGLELTGEYHLSNWLYADLEATFTRAIYTGAPGGGNAGVVALAPTRPFTAGIGARRTFGRWTPFGSLRVKSIADRAATPDGSLVAEGFTLFDGELGLRYRMLELGLDVENIGGATWREVSFATESRLAWEPKPVTGISYSPGWPRTAIGHASVYW